MSFEDALRALEEVVARLESGEVPLDHSISLYERGECLAASTARRGSMRLRRGSKRSLQVRMAG